MYLINTSLHTHASLYDAVLDFVVNQYLPKAMASGHFAEPLLTSILVDMGEDARGMSLQMKTADLDAAMVWVDTVGSTILSELHRRHGAQSVVWFTTPMHIISHE